MICYPGLCIKCGQPIAHGGAPSHNYELVTLVIKNEKEPSKNTALELAICRGCELSESEYPEVLAAVNDYYEKADGFKLVGKIVGQASRLTRAEVQLKRQGGKCIGCHQPIDGNYSFTGGVILHERCSLPRPRPVVDRAIEPGKVVVVE